MPTTTATITASSIERWTIQIADRARTAQRDFTETLVEIGDLLTKVRRALPHGRWLAWLEQMPFAQRSAANYIALSTWAAERPRAFCRLKSLGPSKLYAILRLPLAKLRRMRRDRFYRVPGSDRERTLERMSVPELHALVAAQLGEQDGPRAITRVVAAYRQRLTGLLRATVALVARRFELDRGMLTQLRDALAQVATALRRRPSVQRA